MFSQKRRQTWPRRITLIALILIAAYRLFPYLVSGLRAGAGAFLSAVYLAAYVFTVVALPLMVFALLSFAYSIFIRPYLRLWRLRRRRNARYLKEAIRRGK
jgi:membrane protein implicated in regulation of membrane protease activity